MKFVFAVLSLVLAVGAPAGLLIWNRKNRGKFSFFNFLGGIFLYFMAKTLLPNVITVLMAQFLPVQELFANPAFSAGFSIILPALFLILFWFLAVKFYFRSGMKVANCISLTAGAVFYELLANTLTPAASNLLYLVQNASGGLQEKLLEAQLSVEQAQVVIERYAGYSDGYYLYFGLITTAFLVSALCTALFFAKSVNTGQYRILAAAAAYILVYTVCYYWLNPLTSSIANLILVLLIIGQMVLASRLIIQVRTESNGFA